MFQQLMRLIFNREPVVYKTPVASSLMTPITNVIKELPWHPTKRWARRGIDQINMIIVHQAAIKASGAVDFLNQINTLHITPTKDKNKDGKLDNWERNHLSDTGAPHIAYTFVIERSGKVVQTNPVSDITWHCKGFNTQSIGVLVAGNFDGPHWIGDEIPTSAQVRNLKRLLNILKKRYNIEIENIKGHGELNEMKEACPGYIITDVIKNYRINNA